jgi:hypothetical protein
VIGVAVASAMAVTAGFVAVASRSHVPTCAAPSWDGIWDRSRSNAIVAAFAATRAPFASTVARTAIASLDRFTDTWTQTFVSVCEATEVRHVRSVRTFDLGMACLDERREQARALIELFVAADSEVAEKAVDAVGQLGDPGECADARRLADHPEPPAGWPARLVIEGIRRVLARSRALQTAGRYRDALGSRAA